MLLGHTKPFGSVLVPGLAMGCRGQFCTVLTSQLHVLRLWNCLFILMASQTLLNGVFISGFPRITILAFIT